eukprot:8696363-Pyramimonas_sp.AAC.1
MSAVHHALAVTALQPPLRRFTTAVAIAVAVAYNLHATYKLPRLIIEAPPYSSPAAVVTI